MPGGAQRSRAFKLCVFGPEKAPGTKFQIIEKATRPLYDSGTRAVGEWCNGSTTDSDSVCLGSNPGSPDRKSTRLNSSHPSISYAVFCLKKKKKQHNDYDVTQTKKHSQCSALYYRSNLSRTSTLAL